MACRDLYVPGAVDRMAGLIVEEKFPDLEIKSQEYIKVCNRKDIQEEARFRINIMDLRSRLYDDYQGTWDMEQCNRKAIDLMSSIPNQLRLNVEEWLDNKPLSNIKIHGWTVNKVLDMYGWNERVCFIQVLDAFAYWKKTEFKNKKFFDRFFAVL